MHAIFRANLAFTLAAISAVLCGSIYAGEPQIGNKYKSVQPLYLMAVYDSLNNRQIGRDTARAYLHAMEYYESSWVAFQSKVPEGTILTVIGKAPKPWYRPFSAKLYFVRLEPDLSRGLDVELELNRGIEGHFDGLNPKIFILP